MDVTNKTGTSKTANNATDAFKNRKASIQPSRGKNNRNVTSSEK